MRLVFFLTLVLSQLAQGSPDSTIKPNKIDTTPQSIWQEEGASLIASRSFSQKSAVISIGNMQGILVDKEESRATAFLGLSQINRNLDSSAKVFGLEMTSLGLIGFSLATRNTFYYGNSWDFFYQVALGALYKPQENLATLINYERYQVRIGTGSENLFGKNHQWTSMAELALSPIGWILLARLGYCFPD